MANTEIKALAPRHDPGLIPYGPTAGRLVEVWLSGKTPATLRAYGQSLGAFAAFMEAESINKAAEILLARGHGAANELALTWRSSMLENKSAPKTINRNLSALRSLVKLARTLGMVPWSLEIPGVKEEKYRDTRGPGLEGFRRLLLVADALPDPRRLRDRLLLRLLWDLGLRRNEVITINAENVDLEGETIQITGKGRREPEIKTLPPETMIALRAWLAVRGTAPGPLIPSLDRKRSKGSRLTGAGLYYIIAALGKCAGLVVHPHGIRHSVITHALDLTGGDVRKVQRFSRHRDIRTLTIYDDNRADLAGEVASLVAGAV